MITSESDFISVNKGVGWGSWFPRLYYYKVILVKINLIIYYIEI